MDRLQKVRDGRLETLEELALKDGSGVFDHWIRERKARERELRESSGIIPWPDLDPSTLVGYGRQLKVDGDLDVVREAIQERLLDARDTVTPEEARQMIVLFGNERAVSRLLRRVMIDCRAKREEAKDRRWDERLESTENVLECLRAAIEFFGRHVGVEGVTLDGLSATSGSADYIAMREALVNLFIHQDYTDVRTVAQIEISGNRATFFNAGKALVSSDALIEGGKSQSRNPIISRALRMIGFAELAGSGLRELHRVWRDAKRRPPRIESSPASNTFTLTLDWRPIAVVADKFWKEKLGVKISPEQVAVLSILGEPDGFTVEEVASAQGMLVEDARAAIKSLEKQGLVEENKKRYSVKEHLRSLLDDSRGKA